MDDSPRCKRECESKNVVRSVMMAKNGSTNSQKQLCGTPKSDSVVSMIGYMIASSTSFYNHHVPLGDGHVSATAIHDVVTSSRPKRSMRKTAMTTTTTTMDATMWVVDDQSKLVVQSRRII